MESSDEEDFEDQFHTLAPVWTISSLVLSPKPPPPEQSSSSSSESFDIDSPSFISQLSSTHAIDDLEWSPPSESAVIHTQIGRYQCNLTAEGQGGILKRGDRQGQSGSAAIVSPTKSFALFVWGRHRSTHIVCISRRRPNRRPKQVPKVEWIRDWADIWAILSDTAEALRWLVAEEHIIDPDDWIEADRNCVRFIAGDEESHAMILEIPSTAQLKTMRTMMIPVHPFKVIDKSSINISYSYKMARSKGQYERDEVDCSSTTLFECLAVPMEDLPSEGICTFSCGKKSLRCHLVAGQEKFVPVAKLLEEGTTIKIPYSLLYFLKQTVGLGETVKARGSIAVLSKLVKAKVESMGIDWSSVADEASVDNVIQKLFPLGMFVITGPMSGSKLAEAKSYFDDIDVEEDEEEDGEAGG